MNGALTVQKNKTKKKNEKRKKLSFFGETQGRAHHAWAEVSTVAEINLSLILNRKRQSHVLDLKALPPMDTLFRYYRNKQGSNDFGSRDAVEGIRIMLKSPDGITAEGQPDCLWGAWEPPTRRDFAGTGSRPKTTQSQRVHGRWPSAVLLKDAAEAPEWDPVGGRARYLASDPRWGTRPSASPGFLPPAPLWTWGAAGRL